MSLSCDAPPKRVVLLGASNLARALPVLIELVPSLLGDGRIDVFAALGHGRSYGKRSSVWGRRLPSILECGLWRALEASDESQTFALLTDIGNDIAYGFEPGLIAEWVETCLLRLPATSVRTVITALPRAQVARLAPWQLRLARRFFFPFSTLAPEQISGRLDELDRRLRVLSQAHGAVWVEQQPAWYGVDPIHLRRSSFWKTYRDILAPWATVEVKEPPWQLQRFLTRWSRAYRAFAVGPERRWFLHWQLGCSQPALRFDDHLGLGLY